ncbi:MAG: slipin family protein [Patescibacteria group bacterium]
MTLDQIVPFGVFIIFILLISIREVKEYQRGVRFTFGIFSKLVEPGWRLVIPVFQSMQKADIRTKAVDVPDQEAITQDNVSVKINAVIYYKVVDASKAVLTVENFYLAVLQLAQTTMRNIVGEFSLDKLLKERDQAAQRIREHIDTVTDAWGIDVQMVELKDIILSPDLIRTMAKEAEAERERRAVIISSEGEVMASENISKAAKTLAESPGALHLRTLQSINDISSDQSNTTIWMVPVEALRALEGITEFLKAKK